MHIIFIGGVGGSGTRVVADIFRNNNIFIGSNLNNSLDNLDWPGDPLVIKSDTLSEEKKLAAIASSFVPFVKNMISQASQDTSLSKTHIAVKVPGSFYYIPYLYRIFDQVSYVHLIRHGLDMAYSSNKNQLKNWGDMFGLKFHQSTKEKDQLKYWISANDHAVRNMRFSNLHCKMQIKFEELCRFPESTVEKLFHSLEVRKESNLNLKSLVRIPDTFERYKSEDLTIFDSPDLYRLGDFGYSI